jgi:hypothetical protein
MSNYPQLYLISSEDIKPFTKENLCTVTSENFLSKCKPLFKHFNWGDAIQIDDSYRNNSKYYWDNGWHEMFTEHVGPYFDYGVLDERFSVIDKNLPLDYFNQTMSYNCNAIPWTAKLQSGEIIVNADLNKKRNKFETHFMWRNKKITLSSYLNDINKDHLTGLRTGGSGGFRIGNEYIHYIDLIVITDNFTLPEYLRKHVYEMYRYDNNYKDRMKITKYDGLMKEDEIKIRTDDDSSFETICDKYIITKINLDNDFYNKLRLAFIDSVLKSRYLYFEDDCPNDDKTTYNVEFF